MAKKLKATTLNILGTDYTMIYENGDYSGNPKLTDNVLGYTEPYSKKLVVNDFIPDGETVELADHSKNHTMRHEIIHAFLFESGLYQSSTWAANEEMVDFFAIQIPKIAAAMEKAGVL